MSNLWQKAGKALTYIGGGITLVTFGQGIQQNYQNKKIIETLSKRIELQESILEKQQIEIQKGNDYSNLSSKVSDINESTELAFLESLKSSEIANKLKDSTLDASQAEILKKDLIHHQDNLINQLSKGNEKIETLKKSIEDIFGSNSKFINSNSLDEFQNYLSSLPLEKVGALGHILISFAILLSLLSIISIFYGEFLIKYFNLEEKYPKIARFIQIRRKFQQYYFTMNIIAIILALLLVIYVNFLVFLA